MSRSLSEGPTQPLVPPTSSGQYTILEHSWNTGKCMMFCHAQRKERDSRVRGIRVFVVLKDYGGAVWEGGPMAINA